MRRRRPAALFTIALSASAAAPEAARASPAEIVEYGLFKTVRDGERPGPETTKGTINNVVGYRLVRRTTCVQAVFGVQFGVTVRDATVGEGEPSPARIEIRHPPFAAKDGTSRTLEAWPLRLTGMPLYNGFTFDEPYETVTGRWTIDVVRDGRLIARQGFDVVGPNEGCPAETS